MPLSGRPKVPLALTSDEREQLTRWSRRRSSSQALALRSRIVLGCASGLSNKDVAAVEGVSAATVGKWRARFVELRLDGLVAGRLADRRPSDQPGEREKPARAAATAQTSVLDRKSIRRCDMVGDQASRRYCRTFTVR